MTAYLQNHRVIPESPDRYAAVQARPVLETWSHKPANAGAHDAAGLAIGQNRDGRKPVLELSGWF